MKKEKEIEIKRTNLIDGLEYLGESLGLSTPIIKGTFMDNNNNDIKISSSQGIFYLKHKQAKELAEILPKFLEEMERTK